MSSIDRLLQDKQCILERIEGLGEDNEPVYAFLLIKKTNLDAFRKALAAGDVNLADYGVIVAHGAGQHPPEGLEERLIAELVATN